MIKKIISPSSLPACAGRGEGLKSSNKLLINFNIPFLPLLHTCAAVRIRMRRIVAYPSPSEGSRSASMFFLTKTRKGAPATFRRRGAVGEGDKIDYICLDRSKIKY